MSAPTTVKQASPKRGPLTVFGLIRNPWVVECDNCRVRRFWIWDLRFCGTDFNLCQRCLKGMKAGLATATDTARRLSDGSLSNE